MASKLLKVLLYLNFLPGRITNKRTNPCTRMALRPICSMHHSISSRPYFRLDDIHLHPTQYRRNLQARRLRIGSRKSA